MVNPFVPDRNDLCCLAVLPPGEVYADWSNLANRDRSFEGDCLFEVDSHPADWLIGRDWSHYAGGLALFVPDACVPESVVVVLELSGKAAVYRQGIHSMEQLAANAEGLVPDAMRRSLGLATPKPSIDPAWYWAFRWLQEIYDDGVKASPEILDVEGVISAHPAIDPSELDGLWWSTLGDYCRERHAEHSWRTGWEGIRTTATRGAGRGERFGDTELSIAASWFDEGSFSRWFVSKQPPLCEIYYTIDVMLSRGAAQLVGDVIDDALESERWSP